jgi:multiple sugar transport system substrate-binding protein
MKARKTIALTLILTLLLGAAVACDGGTATTPAATTTKAPGTTPVGTTAPTTAGTTAPPDPYELSVAWWGGEARHKKTLDMIAAYMTDFPYVTVVSTYAAYTDYWTKMATLAAGRNMPDVYLVQLTYVGDYASKGLMRPLQDLVAAGKIDVSNFTPGALNGSSYNGELVGITLGDTASTIVYNKTLIESVGYALPKDQMTWTEYSTYLKGLAEKLPDGVYASDLGCRHEHTIENFARQMGFYGITSEDGKSLGYTKEALTEYLNFHYDMFEAGCMPPLEVMIEDRSKQWGDSLSGNGKIAVWNTNVNQGKIFQASIEDELGMARPIVADDAVNKYVEAAVCSTWAISGNTEKVDESAHFINAMVNDWDLQKIYNMDIGVPGSTVIQEELIKLLDLTNPVDRMKKREIELMRDILNTTIPFNGRPAGYPTAVDDLYKKIDEILYGNMTVEEAVEAHFAAMASLLK